VEPFCGGLGVALGLAPRRALLNDVNPHPVNLYKWIQKGLRIRVAMRNEEALYYAHRDDFNHLVTGRWSTSKRAAELFYYLNRTGYNGLCRFNKSGAFNVPFGRYESITYRRDFGEYQPLLARWTFSEGDFAKLPLRDNDFVYADPPYDVEFRQYSRHGFRWEEQVRLATWLASHRGVAILSNQATDRVVKLYKKLGFKLVFLTAPRRISCNGDRRPATEVLALKNLPKDACQLLGECT
jgi:DNA adenine methylase